MNIRMAAKLLVRRIPSSEFSEHKHLKGFWTLAIQEPIPVKDSGSYGVSDDDGGDCDDLYSLHWGVRRKMVFLGPTPISKHNNSDSEVENLEELIIVGPPPSLSFEDSRSYTKGGTFFFTLRHPVYGVVIVADTRSTYVLGDAFDMFGELSNVYVTATENGENLVEERALKIECLEGCVVVGSAGDVRFNREVRHILGQSIRMFMEEEDGRKPTITGLSLMCEAAMNQVKGLAHFRRMAERDDLQSALCLCVIENDIPLLSQVSLDRGIQYCPQGGVMFMGAYDYSTWRHLKEYLKAYRLLERSLPEILQAANYCMTVATRVAEKEKIVALICDDVRAGDATVGGCTDAFTIQHAAYQTDLADAAYKDRVWVNGNSVVSRYRFGRIDGSSRFKPWY